MKRRTFGNATSSDAAASTLSSNPSSSNTMSSLLQSDKYGLLGPVKKKLQAVSDGTGHGEQNSVEELFKAQVKPSVVVESFEPLSSDFYSKELNINSSKFIF
jgi:hypothetical protein